MEKIKQYLKSAVAVTIGINLISFSAGGAITWTSPVVPRLSSSDFSINPLQIPISTIEESLLVSILMIGALFGTLSGGALSEKIGKRKTLMILEMLTVVSHTMCAFAKNIYVFLSARFLMGILVGTVFTVIPIYISEIANVRNRGVLGGLLSVMGASGQVFIYSVGPFVSIQMFSFINLFPPVLFYTYALFFLPESPYDLIKKGKDNEAEKTLLSLREADCSSDVKKELLELTENLNQNRKGLIADLFKNPILRKCLILTSSLMFIQQFSGICAIVAFMESIFVSSGTQIPPAYIAISISIIALVSSLACSQILDRIGRKLSLLVSLTMCFFSLLILGAYFLLKSKNVQSVLSISWLPVVCLVMFIIFFNFGLGNVPWILIGDIFPSSHKAIASTVTAFCCFIFGSTVTFCFPLFCEFFGQAGTFFIFGGILAFGAIFVAIVLPETKGKTFLDIQSILK